MQHEAPIAELKAAYDALEQSDLEEARARAQALLETARGRSSLLEAHALSFLAHCDRLGSPNLHRAAEQSKRAAQLFEHLGESSGEAAALITLAHVTLVLGRNDEAVEAALLAVRLCADRNERLTVLAYNALGLAYSWINEDERAHDALESAARFAAQCEPPVSAYQPRLNQMWIEASRLQFERYRCGTLGSLDRLYLIASECGRLASTDGDGALLPGLRSMGIAIRHASMGLLAAWQGRFDAAEEGIVLARQALPEYESWLWCFVLCTEAELSWARGNLPGATERLLAMKRIALSVGHERFICRSHLLLAQILAQQGQMHAALKEHHELRVREGRLVRDALRSREELVDWQLEVRRRERELRTALSAAEEAVRENDSKTRFLATASHDLRQPIHSMNVLIAALSAGDLNDETRKIVGMLDTVNRTLARQLDGLLDISKLDASIVGTDLVVQALGPLVASVHAMFEPVARERGISLVLALASTDFVRTDAALLARLLGNLVDNALKFTPKGGRVLLEVTRHDGQAIVRVSDTGIGIPDDAQGRVFEEFFRIDEGETRPGQVVGLGLGLSIVRRLANRLDIDLSLESAHGVGTTVTLRMGTHAAVMQAHLSPVSPVSLDGLNVLLVDDDLSIRQSMDVLLTQLKARVHTAAGSPEAESIARRFRVDIVLTDWKLARQDDARSVIDAVARLRPGARGVILTADTDLRIDAWARTRGIPVLRKPVATKELLAVVAPQRKVG